ncbi:MAG: tail fiber domain-containing protein [bacterium]
MWRRYIGTMAVIISLVCVISFSVWAVPPFINYEGKLTDLAGSPLNGTYEMIFYLYNVETGGTALWSEQQSVTIADGIFNVRLGAAQSLPVQVFDTNELYLEVTIKKSATEPFETLSPRYRMLSTAFAIKAHDADMVDGKHASELGGGDGHSLDAADNDPIDALYVDYLGRVGIGTTNPTQKFHIRGVCMLHDNPGSVLQLKLSAGKDRAAYMRFCDDADAGGGNGFTLGHCLGNMGAHNFYVHDAENAQTRFFIESNGNVGIGTTSPENKLHVVTETNTNPVQFDKYYTGTGAAGYIGRHARGSLDSPSQILSGDGIAFFGGKGYHSGGGFSGNTAYVLLQAAEDFTASAQGTDIFFATTPIGSTSRSDVMVIKDNGSVGIGTTSPGSYKLNIAGTAYCTSGSWSGSDKRWKQEIKPLEGSLYKVNQLQGVSYTWKADEFPDHGFASGEQIGLIAQEVEEIIPALVHTNDDGYKSVSYERLTAVLVEAIKEQQSEIEDLRSHSADLDAHNQELKRLIETLAARIELLENR